MNVFRNIHSLIYCCAGITVLSASTALAADVVDEGKFFSADTIRAAGEKIQELNRRHGYRVKVETIATLPGSESDEVRQMSASDRAKFFGQFLSKRAAAEKLDLLIFASRDPRYLQVLPHKKLEAAGFTTAMRDKMASALMAGFHAQKYDEALSAALTQLEQDLSTVHRASSAQAPVQRAPGQLRPAFEHEAARPPAESGWLGPILLVVALVGGFLLIRRLLAGSSGGGSGAGNNMGGGGGGFMGSMLTGVLGAVAGNWLYDSFLRPTAHGQDFDSPRSEGGWFGSGSDSSSNAGDYTPDSYDSSGGGGGDFGGGGDGGGGDAGGGGDF